MFGSEAYAEVSLHNYTALVSLLTVPFPFLGIPGLVEEGQNKCKA